MKDNVLSQYFQVCELIIMNSCSWKSVNHYTALIKQVLHVEYLALCICECMRVCSL